MFRPRFPAAAAAALALACGGTGPTNINPRSGTITVTPTSITIPVGQTQQITITVRDSLGNTVSGFTVTWASASPSVASVDNTGLVTGVAVGTTTITASSMGLSVDVPVTVTALPPSATVDSVVVSPALANVAVNGSLQLTATLLDSAGNTVNGPAVSWSSSNTAVATVSATGLVSGVVQGNATITAMSQGKSGSAAITVIVPVNNEPVNYTPIVGRRFDSKATADADRGTGSFPFKTGGSEGWDGLEWSQSRLTIVQDSLAPISPSSVLQIRYPNAFKGGVAPGTAQSLKFNSGYGRSPKEIYVHYALKVSADFFGHKTGTNKIQFYWVAGGARVFDRLVGTGTNNLNYQIALQGSSPPPCETRSRLNGNQTAPARFNRDQWYDVEVQMILNTAGQCDGIFRAWLNGQLIIEYTDVGVLASGEANRTWEQLQLRPIWGGGGDTTPNEFFMWVDHMYLSGTP